MDSNAVYGTAAVLFVTSASVLPDMRLEPVVGSRGLANLTVLLSLACIYPFFTYLMKWSPSWTGLSLSDEEKVRIEGPPGHIIGMVVWFVLSLLQALTYRRLQRVHNALGWVSFAVLGLCILEICTNAIFVFLPSKPALLAKAVLGLGGDVSSWQTFLYTNCFR